jgi:hypothetical protein
MLKRDLGREMKDTAAARHQPLGEAAVAMFPNHFSGPTELLPASLAVFAKAAGRKVVNAYAVARFEAGSPGAGMLDNPGNLVAEGEGQGTGI